MSIRISHRACKAWLIAAMAIMLLGVQLLPNSPLHDHAREVVDCALCHLQPLGDDSVIDHSLPAPVLVALIIAIVVLAEASRASHHTPYQGRAPPQTRH